MYPPTVTSNTRSGQPYGHSPAPPHSGAPAHKERELPPHGSTPPGYETGKETEDSQNLVEILGVPTLETREDPKLDPLQQKEEVRSKRTKTLHR